MGVKKSEKDIAKMQMEIIELKTVNARLAVGFDRLTNTVDRLAASVEVLADNQAMIANDLHSLVVRTLELAKKK